MDEVAMKEMFYQLHAGNELQFAIEGKFTNLRIWISHDGPGSFAMNKKDGKLDTIFVRLDRANNYSAPLNDQTICYLEKPSKAVAELLKLGGFKIPIDELSTVFDIILRNKLKHRDCVPW